jgi:hypothetical protein
MSKKKESKSIEVDSTLASLEALSINDSVVAPVVSQEVLLRRKEARTKFLRDGDDSSSEDEEKDSKHNWRDKVLSRKGLVAQNIHSATLPTKESFKFSYIAHEFGKLVLNSTEVRENYNVLKSEHLINSRDVLKSGFKHVLSSSPLVAKETAIIDHIKKHTEYYTHVRSFYKTLSQMKKDQYFISKNGKMANPQLQEKLNESRLALRSCLRAGVEGNGESIDEDSLNSWIGRIEVLKNTRTVMDPSTMIYADEISGVGLLSRARLYNKNSTRAAKNGRAVDATETGIDFIGAGSNPYTRDLPSSNSNLGIFERKISTTGVKEIEWINSGKTRSSSVHFDYSTKTYGELFGHINQDDIAKIRDVLSGNKTYTEIYNALPVTRKTAFAETMHLLFVTEVMKNPACAVIHPMMLELVEAGRTVKGNLAPLYADRKMPASITGAIGASRGLDMRLYSKYTDDPSSYDRTTSSSDSTVKNFTADETKALVKKESDIIKAWLELKEPGISATNPIDMINISRHVSSLCKRWYGFELDKNIVLPVPSHAIVMRGSFNAGGHGLGI